jgi:hypothetical protein
MIVGRKSGQAPRVTHWLRPRQHARSGSGAAT